VIYIERREKKEAKRDGTTGKNENVDFMKRFDSKEKCREYLSKFAAGGGYVPSAMYRRQAILY